MSLWFIFTLTFLIFPGAFFRAQIQFTKDWGKNAFNWFTLLHLILYNTFDTVGRKLAPLYILPVNCVVLLSIARVTFFITTYIIGYNATNFPEKDGIGINSDAMIVINMIMFAFTNGYAGT